MSIDRKHAGKSVPRQNCRVGAFVACLFLMGCNHPEVERPPRATPAAPALASAVESSSAQSPIADLSSFDQIVTAEAVFPDPEVRALYRMHGAEESNGQRAYTFQLIPQAGMNEARHFNLVTVTWAHGGTFVPSPRSTGVAGPNGGFMDAVARTADGAYDVQVTQGMLMPNTVDLPTFDVAQTATRMVQRYASQKRQ